MKRNIKIYAFLLAITAISLTEAHAQLDGHWKALTQLEWNEYYDESLGFHVSAPVFGPQIRELEGQVIRISGYIIPVDTEGDILILSALPFANCFFCGGAGPETVMEVEIKKNRRLINKFVEVEGRLKLNSDDFYQLIYRLESARVISEE